MAALRHNAIEGVPGVKRVVSVDTGERATKAFLRRVRDAIGREQDADLGRPFGSEPREAGEDLGLREEERNDVIGARLGFERARAFPRPVAVASVDAHEPIAEEEGEPAVW